METPEKGQRTFEFGPRGRPDGEAGLQLSVLRTDHRRLERLDVSFRVADLLDDDGLGEVRAEAHVALDRLLDRMLAR